MPGGTRLESRYRETHRRGRHPAQRAATAGKPWPAPGATVVSAVSLRLTARTTDWGAVLLLALVDRS
jgi:hypothetical protein